MPIITPSFAQSSDITYDKAIVGKEPAIRLDFLDGLRGLAALYIAAYHAMLFTGNTDSHAQSWFGRALSKMLSYGHYSVAVFIVLSGFCLALPVARSRNKELHGGFRNYIQRRARRILPPYYAAMALFLALIALLPILQTPHGTAWDSKLPVTFGSVVSHLLLIQNIQEQWVVKIDGPLWSVATEWQIYFVFPFILLPLWKRFGLAASVVTGFLLGLAPHFLRLKHGFNTGLAHPWYLGLFAFGMAASALAFSEEASLKVWRDRFPWKSTLVGVAVFTAILLIVKEDWMRTHANLSESLVGLLTAGLLLHYTLLSRSGVPFPAFLRLLDHRRIVGLGLFSYSIYLIHSPLLGLFNLTTLSFPLSYDLRLCLMLGVAVPLAILASYGFHLLVERRFMSGHQRTEIKKS